MKKSIFIAIAATVVSTAACGQKKEHDNKESAPAVVQTAFQEMFPSVSEVIAWEKESADEWEAGFVMDGLEYSANFLADGTWKETEHVINNAEIPVNLQSTLDSAFVGYVLEEAEIVETSTDTVYEFELISSENELEVVIDANGVVLSQVVETEDQNGDED